MSSGRFRPASNAKELIDMLDPDFKARLKRFKVGDIETIDLSGDSVSKQGFLRIELLDYHRYEHTRHDFKTRGTNLPPKDKLKHFGRTKDLVILLEALVVYVRFKNSSWIEVKLEPGLITDLGSVPWFFRSLVDSRDIDCIVPWFLHDVNYTLHLLTRKNADNLMLKMIQEREPRDDDTGLSVRAKARLAYAAVRVGGAKAWWTGQSAYKRFYTADHVSVAIAGF